MSPYKECMSLTCVVCSYLEVEKKSVDGLSKLEYKWGSRARLEVDKKELLRMMCEVCTCVIANRI